MTSLWGICCIVVAMATSSRDDIPAQLAVLLGNEIVQIRRTDDKPPPVSIIDMIMAVFGGSQHHAARDLRRLSDQYPEVEPNRSHLKFKGRGQRDTPVTDAKDIVEVIMLLAGQQAARVRRQAAELLVRHLSGDLGIIGGWGVSAAQCSGRAGRSATRRSTMDLWRSGRRSHPGGF